MAWVVGVAVALGVGVGLVVGIGVGVGVGVPGIGVGVGVPVGVEVGVAVAVGVGIGVGVGPHVPPVTTIVSTRHPVPLTLESEHIRKRNLIVCPFTFAPRFATVLMYPPELWLHAIRPPIGLIKEVL